LGEFGFTDAEWSGAKSEAKAVLADCARRGETISYSELVQAIRSISLEAHDPRLAELLGQVSSEEDEAGRGLLSVIVVHKGGNGKPGQGFFDLARSRGRDTSDLDRCWIDELKRVFGSWADQRST